MKSLIRGAMYSILLVSTVMTSCEKAALQEPLEATQTIRDDASLRSEPILNIQIIQNATYGPYLADKVGRPLYFAPSDLDVTKDNYNHCYNCNFQPFFTEISPSGINQGLKIEDFKNITRSNGTRVTTYRGWTLNYVYIPANSYFNTPDQIETLGAVNFGRRTDMHLAKPDYTAMTGNIQIIDKDGIPWALPDRYDSDGVNPIFTDGAGRTFYTFKADRKNKNTFTKPDFSNNTEFQIVDVSNTPNLVIPAIYTGQLRIPHSSYFTAINIHGKKQLCFNGWPLYYYKGDVVNGKVVRGSTLGQSSAWPVAAPITTRFSPKI